MTPAVPSGGAQLHPFGCPGEDLGDYLGPCEVISQVAEV